MFHDLFVHIYAVRQATRTKHTGREAAQVPSATTNVKKAVTILQVEVLEHRHVHVWCGHVNKTMSKRAIRISLYPLIIFGVQAVVDEVTSVGHAECSLDFRVSFCVEDAVK